MDNIHCAAAEADREQGEQIAPVVLSYKLYRQHATSEQFHSEFKTDLERLPSGKFPTNDLVMHLGVLCLQHPPLYWANGPDRPLWSGAAFGQTPTAANRDPGVDVSGWPAG